MNFFFYFNMKPKIKLMWFSKTKVYSHITKKTKTNIETNENYTKTKHFQKIKTKSNWKTHFKIN